MSNSIEATLYPLIEFIIRMVYSISEAVTGAIGIPLDVAVVLIAFFAGYGVKMVTSNISKIWIAVIIGALIYIIKSGSTGMA